MKSILLKTAKWTGIVLVGMFVLGVVIGIVDPDGVKRRAEESRAAREKAATVAKDTPAAAAGQSVCFMHGFVLGHNMARDGAVKPTSAQVDALARRSRKALEEGGSGYNVYEWKDAFWAGWNKGD